MVISCRCGERDLNRCGCGDVFAGRKNKLCFGCGDWCGDEKWNLLALRGWLRGSKSNSPGLRGLTNPPSPSPVIVASYVTGQHGMGERASTQARPSEIQQSFPKITSDEAQAQRDCQAALDAIKLMASRLDHWV